MDVRTVYRYRAAATVQALLQVELVLYSTKTSRWCLCSSDGTISAEPQCVLAGTVVWEKWD